MTVVGSVVANSIIGRGDCDSITIGLAVSVPPLSGKEVAFCVAFGLDVTFAVGLTVAFVVASVIAHPQLESEGHTGFLQYP